MSPSGRILVFRNHDAPVAGPVAAVTSLGAMGAVLRLFGWPNTGLHIAREGVPMSTASIEALAAELDERISNWRAA